MKNALTLIAVVLLAGCAAPRPRTEAVLPPPAPRLVCHGADECNFVWRRAQAWVADNAGFKIQVATDSVIATYNAPVYPTGWAFQVRRVPMTRDSDQIELRANCGEVPLCSRGYADTVRSFLAFLNQ